MAKVRIEVTVQDIQQGARGNDLSCPVALAVCRRLKRPVGNISIGFDNWQFDHGTLEQSDDLPLPDDVQGFIRAFDAGDDVETFAFDLEIPDEVLP